MKKKVYWLSELIISSIVFYVLVAIAFALLPQWWIDYVNPILAIGIAYWFGKILGGLYGSIVAPVLVIVVWAGIVRDPKHIFVMVFATVFVLLFLEAFVPGLTAICKTTIRRIKSKTS